MSGLTIVLVLFACNTNLLVCEQVAPERAVWADIGACRAQLEREIRFHRGRDVDHPVVMGRCRYMVPEPDPRHRRSRRAAAS